MKKFNVSLSDSLFDEESALMLSTTWHRGIEGVYLWDAALKMKTDKITPDLPPVADVTLDVVTNINTAMQGKKADYKSEITKIRIFLPYSVESDTITVPLIDPNLLNALETASYTYLKNGTPNLLLKFPKSFSVRIGHLVADCDLFSHNCPTVYDTCRPYTSVMQPDDKIHITMNLPLKSES